MRPYSLRTTTHSGLRYTLTSVALNTLSPREYPKRYRRLPHGTSFVDRPSSNPEYDGGRSRSRRVSVTVTTLSFPCLLPRNRNTTAPSSAIQPPPAPQTQFPTFSLVSRYPLGKLKESVGTGATVEHRSPEAYLDWRSRDRIRRLARRNPVHNRADLEQGNR
jgi:hypothetical protein